MAFCKDPLRTFLNNLGYNVILLPRTGIEPMDVLGKDKDTIERLGLLPQMWTSTVPLPDVKPGSAVSIAGQNTAALDLNVGLKFLSNVLGAMGQSFHNSTLLIAMPKKWNLISPTCRSLV